MNEREQWEVWMDQARKIERETVEWDPWRGVLTHRKINGRPAYLYYSPLFDDFHLMSDDQQEYMALGKTVDDIFNKIGERPDLLQDGEATGAILRC